MGCVRSVKDSGMVTEELVVKDRGVQSVKTTSHEVSFIDVIWPLPTLFYLNDR